MNKRLITVLALLVTLLIASGCTKHNDYADDQFVDSVANGLQARWDKQSEFKNPDEPSADEYKSALNEEYNSVVSYTNKQFKNSELHLNALEYIKSVKSQINTLKSYGKSDFEDKWNTAYNNRTKTILKINNIKKINVNPKYESSLTELTSNGDEQLNKDQRDSAINRLIKNLKFKQTKSEYDYSTYAGVVTNNTDYSFKSAIFNVKLLDKDNVVVETPQVSTNNWNKGETVRFEFMTDKSFSHYKVIKYYVE